MDGTLLNNKLKISKKTKTAIKQAYGMGVHIVISTGRLYANARAYSDFINVRSPVIASNGAVVSGIDKKEIISKNNLIAENCLTLLNIFARYHVNPVFTTLDKIYCDDLKIKVFYELMKLVSRMNKKIEVKYVPCTKQWHQVIKKEYNHIVKCEVNINNIIKHRKVREALEDLKEFEIVGVSNNIEITKKGVSKGKAIELLSKHYGIAREEIIAIGDSENDLTMIEFAGIGVAMGNAADILKQKADYITDTNDKDGVANIINKFVLGKT